MSAAAKSRVLYVLKYLRQQSDEEHPATINQIIEYLASIGIDAGRKTISDDIEQLQEAGYDIICIKSRQNKYFMGARALEISELKMLVDAVQAATFIPPRKSKELISKLSELVSIYQASILKRRLYVNDRIKTGSNNLLYTVDTIYFAISSGRCLSFKSFDYSPAKRKIFKRDGLRYIFSPYDLVWSNDRYYVFGYSEHHDDIVKFRVDRIHKPEIIDSPAKKRPSDYNIAQICNQTFLMYDAEVCTVELLCENSTMNAIIDHFGIDTAIEKYDDEHFIATARTAVSVTFFAWIFTYCGKIRIISPQSAVDGYKRHLEMACENA